MDPATADALAHLLVTALLLVLAGTVAGVVAGLLGIGGGIVTVPALFYVFGTLGVADEARMHLAVGTSLALIVPTALSSARAHHARGAVDFSILRRWAPPMLLGVVLGTLLASQVDGRVLSLTFAGVAMLVAATMLFGRPQGQERTPSKWLDGLAAAAIGAVSVMVGVGGGAIVVMTLSLLGYAIHRAIGTAAALGLVVAVPGAIGFALTGLEAPGRTAYCLGYLHLPAIAFMLPAVLLAAPLGVRLAHRLKPRPLRIAFALFMLMVAGRMIWELSV
ncbi:MAG: sulfite exporter TauE/SafE family protein [Pseudomonadota bacterium]